MRLRVLLLASSVCVVGAFAACDSDQQVYDDTKIDWDGAFPDANDGSGGTSGSAGVSGSAGSLNLGGMSGSSGGSGTGGMAGEAGGTP